VSYAPCRTPGCPHRVVVGLDRRSEGEGTVGQLLAGDGRCWRCRHGDVTAESRRRGKAQMNARAAERNRENADRLHPGRWKGTR